MGDGKYFIEAQNSSGIDALVLFAIAAHESAYGTSSIAHAKNNLFGYGAYDSSPGASAYSFNDLESGIVGIANKIGKYYVSDRGQDTLYKIEHDPAGTGYKYASDQQWDTKVAGHLEKFMSDLGISFGDDGFAGLRNAVVDNTTATQEATVKEKTISEQIDEILKTSTSYSQNTIDDYMKYVAERDIMNNVEDQARIYGEDDAADTVSNSRKLRDLEETFSMQLDLYTESGKKLLEQYDALQKLYWEKVESGADTEVLSEIITAMSEVSAKIDSVSDKWQNAIEDMGESFTAIIGNITSTFTEAISRSDRYISNLEHMLNVTGDNKLIRDIYLSIQQEQNSQIANTKAIMEAVSQTAAYQRNESESNSALGNVALKEYAATQGNKVRNIYSDYIGSFGDYESWFNSNGTINTEAMTKAIADYDDNLKEKATDFANWLTQYKVVWSNEAAQQFPDIMSKFTSEEIHSFFDGNGEITRAAYDMLSEIEDTDYKNRLSLFLTYQSSLKKIYYEGQENLNKYIEDRYSTWEKLVDNAKDSLSSITGIYDTLKSAAKEYADSGFITIDTLQNILSYGVNYLSLLKDENGVLKINEETIKKVTAARLQDYAIQEGLNYISQLQLALEEDNAEKLQGLLSVQEDLTASTWGYVYAKLAELNLSDQEYTAAKNRLDTLRQITDIAKTSIGQETGKNLEALNSQSDALEKILEYTIAIIKQEKQDRIEALNDELQAYRDIINAQKESLSLSREQNNYNKTVSEKLKEISKLQTQINQLSLDDSREAQAEKKSLEEELAELQTDLSDYQADYAYDATVDALDKMTESYEEYTNNKIEAIEDEMSSYQKLYDEALVRIKTDGESLFSQFINWNYEYGNDIEETIITAWDNAIDKLKEYNFNYEKALRNIKNGISASDDNDFDTIGGSSSQNDSSILSNSSGYSNSNASITDLVALMKTNSSSWAASSDKESLERANVNLANKLNDLYHLGVYFDEGTGLWKLPDGSNLYDRYHTGGIAGGVNTLKDNEVMAVLEKGEAVLDAPKKESLYRFIDISTYMLEKFGISAANISSAFTSELKPMSGYFDSLNSDTSSSIDGIKERDLKFNVESLEVTTPIQVIQKLDEASIKEYSEEIGSISAEYIQKGFTKRGIRLPSGLL